MMSQWRRFLEDSGFAEARVTLLAMGVCGAGAAALMPWTRFGGQVLDPTIFDSGPGQPTVPVLRVVAIVALGVCAWLGGSALRVPLDRRARGLGVLWGGVAGLAAVLHLLDLRGVFLEVGSLGGLLHEVLGADQFRPGVGMWLTLSAGALVAVKTLFAQIVVAEPGR